MSDALHDVWLHAHGAQWRAIYDRAPYEHGEQLLHAFQLDGVYAPRDDDGLQLLSALQLLYDGYA